MNPETPPPIYAEQLLRWYDIHARSLPWRIPPAESKRGKRQNAYRVWLSEIMLQQTTTEAVKPYFAKFMRQWPDLAALSRAPLEDILKAWVGLGYYSRARNLKACADSLAAEHGGHFPQTAAELRRLPGIGAYTSAAIAAIAFDEPCAVVDANIERVIARLFRVEMPLPAAKPQITALCQSITPRERAGDFAQAMMDLGAGLCAVKQPECLLCPLRDLCQASKAGMAAELPRKAPKKAREERAGAAFIIQDAEGRIYLEKRTETGLLGGMTQPPNYFTRIAAGAESAAETEKPSKAVKMPVLSLPPFAAAEASEPSESMKAATEKLNETEKMTDLSHAPFAADWRYCGQITHIFSHFRLTLNVYTAAADNNRGNGFWVKAQDLPHEALPTVFKKALACALPGIFLTASPKRR